MSTPEIAWWLWQFQFQQPYATLSDKQIYVMVTQLVMAWTGDSSTHFVFRRSEEVLNIEVKLCKSMTARQLYVTLNLSWWIPKIEPKSWNNEEENQNTFNKILLKNLVYFSCWVHKCFKPVSFSNSNTQQ